jgi:hypothetical protein
VNVVACYLSGHNLQLDFGHFCESRLEREHQADRENRSFCWLVRACNVGVVRGYGAPPFSISPCRADRAKPFHGLAVLLSAC